MNDGHVKGIEADAGHSLSLVADVFKRDVPLQSFSLDNKVLSDKPDPKSTKRPVWSFGFILTWQITSLQFLLQPEDGFQGFQIWALTGPVRLEFLLQQVAPAVEKLFSI